MFIGFVIFTAGIVGLATVQPTSTDDTRTLIYAALAGLGFGAPLILVIAGVQLSTPHHLIATATAATTCSRAVATAAFTAIFSAALGTRLGEYIPQYIARAASAAGLPRSSLKMFIKALSGHDLSAVKTVPGVDPAIIDAGIAALKQAYADGLRVVFIIAAPFGALAVVACFFLGDLSEIMNYGVDAPYEDLRAKDKGGD